MKLREERLEVEIPIEGEGKIYFFRLQEALNAHAKVELEIELEEEKIGEAIEQISSQDKIVVKQKDKQTGKETLVFQGKIFDIKKLHHIYRTVL